jgi:hypothetical protein
MLNAERHTSITLQIKHIDDFLRYLDSLKNDLQKERTALFSNLGQQYFYDLKSVEVGDKIILSKYDERTRTPFDLRYDEAEKKLFFSGDIFFEKKDKWGKDNIEHLRRRMSTVKLGNRKVKKIAYCSWYIDTYSDEDAQEIKGIIKEIISSFVER